MKSRMWFAENLHVILSVLHLRRHWKLSVGDVMFNASVRGFSRKLSAKGFCIYEKNMEKI